MLAPTRSSKKYKTLCGLQSNSHSIVIPYSYSRNTRNPLQELAVVKSVQGHPRVENEREILRKSQDRTPYLRPVIDEIKEPSEPVAIVLKHLQSDLLQSSIAKTLNRKELKYVSRCVLEAIRTLHDDGFVHTGTR